LALAAVSIVTVSPSAIVTSSAEVGTTPPAQVAVLLQLPPPVPLDVILAALAAGRTLNSIIAARMIAVFSMAFLGHGWSIFVFMGLRIAI